MTQKHFISKESIITEPFNSEKKLLWEGNFVSPIYVDSSMHLSAILYLKPKTEWLWNQNLFDKNAQIRYSIPEKQNEQLQ